MAKMKVAVLGAGRMGDTVIKHLKQCEPIGEILAQDIRPERVTELRRDFGLHATTDLKEILNDPSVRLVFITSDNCAHKELVMASFAAGKAVMCEKPIATTLKDSRLMVEESERRKLFFQIGFELRYSRLYTRIKDWIDAGLLGQVNNSQCFYVCNEFIGKDSWRIRKAACGGMFGEKLSHYVDLPRWWIGSRVTEVYSACSPNIVPYYEIRDNYHTTYRFENGAVSHLTFHMAVGATFEGDPLQDVLSQQKDDGHALQYLVVGAKGAASTDVFRRRLKRWVFGDSPRSMTSSLVEDATWDPSEDQEYFHNTYSQTADIVRRVAAGLPPATPARDAYETMKVVEAAERSADEARPIRLYEMD